MENNNNKDKNRCMFNPIFLAHAIDKFAHARKDSVDDHILTTSQRNLMMVVGYNEGSTQLELARMSHLKPPTVCIAMQKMEDLGYVIRKTDEKDMRQVRIYLTEKGKERNRRIGQSMHDTIELARQGMTDEEWETLTALMKRVCENLRDEKKKFE